MGDIMVDCVVIGGGAAGLMAAGVAAGRGREVVLVEKNRRVGRKLIITGKGRCNVTNMSDANEIIQNVRSNPKFMFSPLAGFDAYGAWDFFERYGVELKVERGNRVFPVSDKSGDIVAALERFCAENGVSVKQGSAVKGICVIDGRVTGVKLDDNSVIEAESVLVATGGLSYPATGSTGDGFKWARELGHMVKPLMPSLCPLIVKEKWVKELEGLSLRNVRVGLHKGGRCLFEDMGEMLFTSNGVSGPLILSASAYVEGEGHTISIDLKPALDEQTLDARILRDFGENLNRAFKNALGELLPRKIIPVIIELTGINPEKRVCEITREERRRLLGLIKNLEFQVKGLGGFDEAVITRGGVDVNEVNAKTMESKIVAGLYFAGEVLDLDAFTGGYNLQIAFSTGHAAGRYM